MSSPEEIAGFGGANKAPAWTGRRDFEALSGPLDGVSMEPKQATGDPMAYNSGVQLAGLAGIVGGGLGAYFGYNYAIAESMPPVQGALILDQNPLQIQEQGRGPGLVWSHGKP